MVHLQYDMQELFEMTVYNRYTVYELKEKIVEEMKRLKPTEYEKLDPKKIRLREKTSMVCGQVIWVGLRIDLPQ